MEPSIPPLPFAVVLLGWMLILLEIGRRLGIMRRSKASEGERGYSASDADLAGKQALFIPDAATSGTIPGN